MWARVLLLCALALCVSADIPHEDPGLMFRAGDRDRSGEMDSLELSEFFTHREAGYNGKVIADMAGGEDKAIALMDTDKNGKVSADEFLTHVSPSYHKAIAEEDFDNADTNNNGSLDLEEYKSSNYGMERVPEFVHQGFEDHFNELDLNKDKALSKEEYVEAASQDHFSQMDYNHDNIVTLAEYRTHKHTHYWSEDGGKPVPPEADNTKAGFDQLDLNKDGQISRSEEAFALMPGEDEVRAAMARGENDEEDSEDNDEGAED